MAAWQAGIVVVTSAGNTGPDPMTVGVPGNVPYVITVGAMTDNFTAEDPSDDFLASFSSTGPTTERFVKPEFLAPGGHAPGIMDKGKRIPKRHPHFHDGEEYFVMSGTSQATAAVSGAVAQVPRIKISSARSTNPIVAPMGRYLRKPARSSAKSTSSIMTTKRNSTITAPT